MQAVVINEYGGPEALQIQSVPEPRPGPEDLLVDVVATALNRADILQRMGMYPGPKTEFEVPGLEFAGRVVSMGSQVRGWSVGDPVMGIVAGGAYAEQLTVHHRQAIPVPDGIDLLNAAAIPESFMTAFDALMMQCGLTSGGRALVHAGGSGLGTAAIQLVRAWGGEIAVTCSTRKVERCQDLGANLVVDYSVSDFGVEVREWAGPGGVDVVLDVIGAEYLERNIDLIRVGGTVIQVGVMGIGRAELNLLSLLPKRAHLIGTVLRARPLEEKIALAQRFRREVSPRFASGELRPIVHTVMDFGEVSAAHELMAANANFGKIVLRVA